MDILLWVLQVFLALHTAVGAVWKFSNSEQSVPSLRGLPHGAWLALSAVELLCCLGLIVPAFRKRMAVLAPVAAGCIAAEMLLFTGLHVSSGSTDQGPAIYWMVVAAICVFIVYGRVVLRPLPRS